jgi:hypothetical protein
MPLRPVVASPLLVTLEPETGRAVLPLVEVGCGVHRRL